jgi:hypothetical protein
MTTKWVSNAAPIERHQANIVPPIAQSKHDKIGDKGQWFKNGCRAFQLRPLFGRYFICQSAELIITHNTTPRPRSQPVSFRLALAGRLQNHQVQR